MLNSIPIYAVLVEDLGERGAHYMAYKEFCKEITPAFTGVMGKGSIRDSNDTESCEDDFDHDEHVEEDTRLTYFRGINAFSVVTMVVGIGCAFLLGSLSARQRK